MGDSCKKKLEYSQNHMYYFYEQILYGLSPLKCMTSKIRGAVEKLIPLVLIFNRSLNVRSTTFPLFLHLILMDVSCCRTGKRLQKQHRNAVVGGFFVASSPFFRQYFHALNYLISGFFSLHLSWSESMNAAVRIVDNRTTALFVKNKAMGYISSYYNVAGQDKANYLPHPPPQRDSLCYSHLFARW